jgi:hypothetical protein
MESEEYTTVRVSAHVRQRLHRLQLAVMGLVKANPHLYGELQDRVLSLSEILSILLDSAESQIGVR